MKKTDYAMIILIASMSVLIAYFVAKAIPVLNAGSGEPVKVLTAEPIVSEVAEPDKAIFNENAINPTVEVTIGGDSSQGTP